MAKKKHENRVKRVKEVVAAVEIEEAWLADNPLRQWIACLPQRRKVADVARLLDRTHQQVYYYLSGHSYPKAEQMARLAELMRIDYQKLEIRWRKWWLRKPEKES